MDISTLYDINRIVNSIEAALQIDGVDYAEKDMDVVIKNVKNRIIRQYQIDLTQVKITDTSLYLGKSRNKAAMFTENIAALHGQLCGYLQIARFTQEIKVRPVNVNFLGFTEKSLTSMLQLCLRKKTLPGVNEAFEAIKIKVCSINNCLEKKVFMIMIVCHELGFDEMVAAIAEILYLGGKV